MKGRVKTDIYRLEGGRRNKGEREEEKIYKRNLRD